MKTLSKQFSLGRGTLILLSTTALCLFLLATCTDKSTSPKHDDVEEVSNYLEALPSWSEFSPPQSSQSPTPIGEAEQEPDVIMDVDLVDEHGGVYTEKDVIFSCQVQPYTLSENPEKIAMYSPDRELVWPGALIQGKSHRDGLGSLLGLPIAERAPIRVSIPVLASDDNFRTVDRPNQAEVDQAIGSMIGAATESGLRTPSTITFSMETFHSETQMALEMKVSGRYLGFTASASGSYDRNRSETTVTAQFYQKMFEVVVEPPQSPGDFFSADFTEARLQQQVNMGRIGPNNLPVYISNVVYGRMMMFSMTSTASEDEIRATLQAGYNTIGKGVDVELDARHKSILQESKIMVTSIGGDAQATLNMIKSGDWSEYFTENAPLSSASPLSYTFRNLGDGSIAGVTETTEYNIRTCEARQALPGTFIYLNSTDLGRPIPAPVTTTVADVNGNDMDDLIWNHLSSTNQTAISFANGDGTFATPVSFTHPAAPQGGWGRYRMVVGDFNGNGRADLVWSERWEGGLTYTAYSNGDGTFDFFDPQNNSRITDEHYVLSVADLDGDGKDDLVWNRRRDRFNHTSLGFSNGDGTFDIPDAIYDATVIGGDWTHYSTWLGDVNNDGKADIVWSIMRQHEIYVRSYMFRERTVGSWFDGQINRSVPGSASTFVTASGNITGRNGMDLVWVSLNYHHNPPYGDDDFDNRQIPISRSLSNGDGTFTFYQGWGDYVYANIDGLENDVTFLLADVNGNGRDDIVLWNKTEDEIHVGLATGDDKGRFSFSRVSQVRDPSLDDWGQFQFLTGDFNGNGLMDILWNDGASRNRVYVGLARDN